MTINTFIGILIPFLGTSLGSAFVLFMKKEMDLGLRRALTGFASGIMVSASVWSLIIPSIDYSSNLGRLSFLPASIGFMIGILFLLVLDNMLSIKIISHQIKFAILIPSSATALITSFL